MTDYVVLLQTAPREHIPYGPFGDKGTADLFAAYLTSEVDPAKTIELRSPVRELIGFWRNAAARGTLPATWRPEFWPPQPGHIWQDRNKDRWVGAGSGYLVCLAARADDSAEEIWRCYGPMTFVQCVSPTEEEVPF